MSNELPQQENRVSAEIRERVKVPGAFLLIVGGLNLLISAVAVGGLILLMDKQRLEDTVAQLWRSLPPEVKQSLEADQMNEMTLRERVRDGLPSSLGWHSFSLLCAGLSFLGGVRMMQLRSYGLAV